MGVVTIDTQRLVPDEFVVPRELAGEGFLLRPLGVRDLVQDYDAVMSSVARLRHTFGPGDPWPEDDLTLEQDLVDLGWHQKEFERRSSFAYTVVSPDGAQCLGCVYLYPSEKRGHDVKVFLWVRASHAELDAMLYATVRSWLARDWPFERPAFPGREIDWSAWAALPDRRLEPA
jgi:hypothetical protein